MTFLLINKTRRPVCSWKVSFKGRSLSGRACACWKKKQRVSTLWVWHFCSDHPSAERREGAEGSCPPQLLRPPSQPTPSCASFIGAGRAGQKPAFSSTAKWSKTLRKFKSQGQRKLWGNPSQQFQFSSIHDNLQILSRKISAATKHMTWVIYFSSSLFWEEKKSRIFSPDPLLQCLLSQGRWLLWQIGIYTESLRHTYIQTHSQAHTNECIFFFS